MEVDDLNPSYYRCGGIRVDDVIDAYGLNFYLANVLKYILRAGKKSGDRTKDLGKALKNLQRELKNCEEKDLECSDNINMVQ